VSDDAEQRAAGAAHQAEAERAEQARARSDDAGGDTAQANGDGDGQRDLEAELAASEDRYKRALADLDNYRKRSARETERRVADAREDLLRDWLQALDSVERAIWMEPENPMLRGLQAVLEQMEAILAREGVTRVGAVGEPFDPAAHEAISVRPEEGVPDRTIVDVARSGFALGDHVLRPAQVAVARAGGRDEG
jgi:molecular chaperone GrpE